MKTHSDSGDYTYTLTPAKEPLRKFDIQPWPEKAQARMDELEKRIRHLEVIVHMMLNPEEA